MKNILITGATGFIGTNLCLKLFSDFKFTNQENLKIYAIDNHVSSDAKNLKVIKNFLNFKKISEKNFVFYYHDICQTLDFLPIDKIDVIYNLACPASPPRYQKDPIFTFKTSIWGVDNLAQLALRHKARLIHTSTSEVYGDALVHPQHEDYFGNVNTVGARSCYDEGKRASETLIYGYIKTRNLNAKIVRIFNTFGPYMDKNDGRVVSNFINQALKNQDITIYGTGKQTRSFCYIDDLLDILVKIANSQDDFYGPINIGNPNEFSVEKIAKIIIELTKSSSQIVNCPPPQDDPKQRQPDINLAQNKYKFKPQISLEDGLKKTIEYFVQKQ
ncbi:MAG: NAD-dependent epimerase/dehydratase family protein [Proteobacteria bacterium]|nr:NAD-dependent epimerase/dehydratase family protein [Pseudomonadota bacterium]